MEYTKIHPFDFYELLSKETLGGDLRCLQSAVTVRVSAEGHEPYTFQEKLVELNGKVYLRTTNVDPAPETLAKLFKEDLSGELKRNWDAMLAARAAGPKMTITYGPESE